MSVSFAETEAASLNATDGNLDMVLDDVTELSVSKRRKEHQYH